MHIVPVHATVIILLSSTDEPHDTNTAGSGYIIVPGFQFCRAIVGSDLLYVSVFSAYTMSAIMASNHTILRVDKLKLGFHRLVVGDTFRVITLYNAYDSLRKSHRRLFYHFKIVYDINLCSGSDKRYAVDNIIREESVGNLDYTFCPELFRVEIVANRHMLVKLLDA